jgi:hypothetical protein
MCHICMLCLLISFLLSDCNFADPAFMVDQFVLTTVGYRLDGDISRTTCSCQCFQAQIRQSRDPMNVSATCVHLEMLPNCCLAMKRSSPQIRFRQRFLVDSPMGRLISEQLTKCKEVVLLSSAGRPGDLKYLVMMSQSAIVPGRNAQACRHHVLCTFRVRSLKSIHGYCSFPTCQKSINKKYAEISLDENVSAKICVHLQKVFEQPNTRIELQRLADESTDPASQLDSVVFDCVQDRWLPAPQCPQTPIPLKPSSAQSQVLMTYSLAGHIQKNSNATKPSYLSNKNIHGKPCYPAFSSTCLLCGNGLSETSDYKATDSLLLQYSSALGVVERTIMLLVCSASDCSWRRIYDPDVDCLHCFSKNLTVWHAGE